MTKLLVLVIGGIIIDWLLCFIEWYEYRYFILLHPVAFTVMIVICYSDSISYYYSVTEDDTLMIVPLCDDGTLVLICYNYHSDIDWYYSDLTWYIVK